MAGSLVGPENSTIVVFPKLFIVCPPSYITSPGSQVTLEVISARAVVLLIGPTNKYKFVEFIVLRPEGPYGPVVPGGPVWPGIPCGP